MMAVKWRLIKIVKNCKMSPPNSPWANCVSGGEATCRIYVAEASAGGSSPLKISVKGKGAKKRVIVCSEKNK